MAEPSGGPSVLGLTLFHPLNVLMLAGAGVSAALTGSVVPLAVGAAVELLWLTVGARMGGAGAYLQHVRRQSVSASSEREVNAALGEVTEADRRRYLELDRLRGDIRRLVQSAGTIEKDMLQPEVVKVDRLVDSFVDLAARAARYEAFLAETDLNELEEQVRLQEKLVDKAPDPEAKRLAADNLEVMQARLQRGAEVGSLAQRARGQLNLVENTLRLLRDQIASLDDPSQVSGQLDELVRSVEAIEASAKETRRLEVGRRQGAAH